MGFPAKYSGICLKCRKDVTRGQIISWSRTKGQKGVYHIACDTTPMVYRPPKAPKIQYHATHTTPLEKWGIGSHVRVTGSQNHYMPIGTVGIIRGYYHGSFNGYNVEAIDSSWAGGHSCNGDCEVKDKGQHIRQDQLELVTTTTTTKEIEVTPESEDQDLVTSTQEKETMPVSTVPTDQNTAKALDALQTLLAAMSPKTPEAPPIDAEQIRAIVRETLSSEGTLKIEIREADNKPVTIDLCHHKLPDLIYFTSKRKHVYLHGPHGSGKSTAAQQAAESLNLKYGYISLTPQTPESRLLGYMTATGNYARTPFRDCYENGGVFCIDELDNSSPALLTTLNGGFENGHMAFPDNLVPRHSDFVVVGTGNTSGRGANPSYPERRPFDSAFGDRFVYIEWTYDEQLEKRIALAINKDAKDWVKWVQSVRAWAAKNHPRFVPSPRATFRLAEFMKDSQVSKSDILDAVVWRGDHELQKKVLANCPLPV